MKFLSVEEVIEIHSELIKISGGLDGIRDRGLLISAIEMPKAMMFGKFLHETVYDKAAAYLYHIVCNHAFLDGNKRTGAITALVFLQENGSYNENIDEQKYEDMVCNVAQGLIKKNEISEFLSNFIHQKTKL